jgi:hypothetical protein
MKDFIIQALKSPTENEISDLCDVLIDCVEGGASVSFMLPLERCRAKEFWINVSVRRTHIEPLARS